MFERIREVFTETPEQKLQREGLIERANNIEVFPGSLREYERFRDNQYQIIDVPGPYKYLSGSYFDSMEIKSGIVIAALHLGATAIIRYQREIPFSGPIREQGIPVKPKED